MVQEKEDHVVVNFVLGNEHEREEIDYVIIIDVNFNKMVPVALVIKVINVREISLV